MKGLDTLIRLNKGTVDEKRRTVSELRKAEDRILSDREALERQVEAEQRIAGESVIVGSTYAGFAQRVIRQREMLQGALNAIRREIARAEEELAEAFQELKRYELALEEQKNRRIEDLKRLETQRFDEVASTRFSRGDG